MAGTRSVISTMFCVKSASMPADGADAQPEDRRAVLAQPLRHQSNARHERQRHRQPEQQAALRDDLQQLVVRVADVETGATWFDRGP